MKRSTRKKTISILLVAALALTATIKTGEEQKIPAIMPEEISLDILEEQKDKFGRRRKLPRKNM